METNERDSGALTHARKRVVAIPPLPVRQTLNAGVFMGLEMEALLALIDSFGAHGVFLAKNQTVPWRSGDSAGDC